MRRFLVRRLAFVILAFFGATIFVFGLSRMAKDPRELFIPDTGYGINQQQWEELGRQLGFDKPVVVQYFLWIGRMLKGDFGTSLGQRKPVIDILKGKWGATLQLALGGWLFAVLVGVPLGVLAAVKRGTIVDLLGRGFALFGQALPGFWTGIMFILLFAVVLHWLPAGTRGTWRGFPLVWTNIKYYVLPSIVLGWPAAAGIMRLTRSSMLEVLDAEYIKFARAKGVSTWKVIWKHALRNSLIVPLTSTLFLMAGYLNGALVVETVFSWPGIGWIALNRAVYDNDFPLLLGSVFFFVSIFLFFSFIADVLYAYIDPRIRYQ